LRALARFNNGTPLAFAPLRLAHAPDAVEGGTPRAKLRHLAANLGLLAGSRLASLLFAEVVVIGIFLKPHDALATVSLSGVAISPTPGPPPSATPMGCETHLSINAPGAGTRANRTTLRRG
jgi:hypothetical protein